MKVRYIIFSKIVLSKQLKLLYHDEDESSVLEYICKQERKQTMLKNLFKPFILITFLVPAVASSANISNNSLDQLMQQSGLNKQIQAIPAGILVGMKQSVQQGAPINDEQLMKIENSVNNAFKPAQISNTISSTLKRALSQNEAEELLTWYSSDLGKKITIAEEQASEASAYQDMLSQAQTLMADEERVTLARQIDTLVKASEMSFDLQKYTAVAVYTSVSNAMQPGNKVDIEAFEAELAKQEPQMRQQIQQLVTLSLVYNYKDFSTDEIKQYIGFLERPASKKFNNNALSGMKLAINSSVDNMAESLASVFTAP